MKGRTIVMTRHPIARVAFLVAVASLAAGLAGAASLSGTVRCKGVATSADAIVYVAEIPGKTFPPGKEPAKMGQTHLRFVPRVLPVLVGTTVEFLNSDAVNHNIFSPDKCTGRMNLGTWSQGQTRSYTFKQECAATLLCNLHPEMEGWIVAVPTPYFAVTGADGSYRINDLPDGSLTVKIWHPKLKAIQKTVAVQGATEASFELP